MFSSFSYIMGKIKALCQKAEDKKILWYHLNLPHTGPHGVLTNPHAVTGVPVFAYLIFSKAAPKGIPYPGPHCLAPPGSSLAERSGYVLVFIIALSISVAI